MNLHSSNLSSNAMIEMIYNYGKESIKPLKEAGVDFSNLDSFEIRRIIEKHGVEIIKPLKEVGVKGADINKCHQSNIEKLSYLKSIVDKGMDSAADTRYFHKYCEKCSKGLLLGDIYDLMHYSSDKNFDITQWFIGYYRPVYDKIYTIIIRNLHEENLEFAEKFFRANIADSTNSIMEESLIMEDKSTSKINLIKVLIKLSFSKHEPFALRLLDEFYLSCDIETLDILNYFYVIEQVGLFKKLTNNFNSSCSNEEKLKLILMEISLIAVYNNENAILAFTNDMKA
jgi:hypothetical protein